MTSSNGIIRESINELASYIHRIIDKNDNPFGLSIAIVNADGLIWSEGFGFTDHTRAERVTSDTLFSTQSMGKCFTATAFLIMASKNLVNLDDTIRMHYPEFTINTIFGTPDSEIGRITFRRMLSHTAGFTHEALVGNNYDSRPCTFEEHITSIGEGWLKSPVGSEMSYSNLGYDLTAYAMGRICGKTFPQVMTEELFRPLGIMNATFDINEAMKKSLARGYDGPFPFPTISIPMLGAGGLFISVNEVAKLIMFHLCRGAINEAQLVRPILLDQMYLPQQQANREFGYGFGLYTTERIAGAKVYGHGGGGYGYQTNMMFIPDFGIGVVVLSNNMQQSFVGSIAKKALELMIQTLEKPSTSPSGEDLINHCGTYVADGNLSPHLLRISCADGKLFANRMDGTVFELTHEGGTKFSTPIGLTCTFELDKTRSTKTVFVDGSPFPFIAKYNDGPLDEVGPNKMEWGQYLGIYLYEEDARPAYMAVSMINGYLYLTFGNNLRLHEHDTGIFFTAEGEVVTFDESTMVYKGIPAKRVPFDATSILNEIEQAELKYDHYRFAIPHLASIIHTREGIEATLDFLEIVVRVDQRFQENYAILGKKLFALGALQDADACLHALLGFDSDNEDAKSFIAKIDTMHK